MSLFGNYIKEREGKEIVETDHGFATFFFINEGCYIQDLYVAPDYRKKNLASSLADQIAGIAKERGCSNLYGSVSPSTNGSTESLKVLLSYGFKLDSCGPNLIVMKKEI